MAKGPELDQTKIAVINTNISYIQKDISDIKAGIKELSGVYITKLQFDDLQIAVEKRLAAIEKNKSWIQLITPILVSIISVVLTFLVMFYIQNVRL